MNKKTILITGGAGFIGTHLAENLSKRMNVILFDNFRRNSLSFAPLLRKNKNVKIIKGDILDKKSVEKAMKAADIVIHLAAIAGVSSYYKEPLKTLRVNILGTENTLNAAARHKIETFIYFSTSEIYGSKALGVKEERPAEIGPISDKRWVYATSKLAGENLTLRYGEEFGFKSTVIRPFNIYGPRQVGEGAISNFCKAAVSKEPLLIYGNGKALRAWCYISDLIRAVELVLSNHSSAGQIFNIGNPRAVKTTLELAKLVARLVPGTRLKYKEIKRFEIMERVPSIAKSGKILKYAPKVSIEEGVKKTLEWFAEQEEKLR